MTDARVEAAYAETLAGGDGGNLRHEAGYAETLLRRVETAETDLRHVLGYVETTARYPSDEVFLRPSLAYAEVLHSISDVVSITGTGANDLDGVQSAASGTVTMPATIKHTISLRGGLSAIALNATYQPRRLTVSAKRRTVTLSATWVPKL